MAAKLTTTIYPICPFCENDEDFIVERAFVTARKVPKPNADIGDTFVIEMWLTITLECPDCEGRHAIRITRLDENQFPDEIENLFYKRQNSGANGK